MRLDTPRFEARNYLFGNQTLQQSTVTQTDQWFLNNFASIFIRLISTNIDMNALLLASLTIDPAAGLIASSVLHMPQTAASHPGRLRGEAPLTRMGLR
jgi:hypothetical protein